MSSTSANKSVREVLAEPADRTDRELVWVMAAMVVIDLVASAYVAFAGVRQSILVFVVATELAPPLLQAVPILRARSGKTVRYSPGGLLWLLITVSASIVWHLAVIVVSGLTGWWSHGQPFTFEISVVIGLAPLLFGIWTLSSKVRALEC